MQPAIASIMKLLDTLKSSCTKMAKSQLSGGTSEEKSASGTHEAEGSQEYAEKVAGAIRADVRYVQKD